MARAFRLAVEDQRGGQRTYNVGTGTGVSLSKLVDIARSVTGRKIPVRHQPPKNEPQRLVADSNRLSLELAWKPSQSSPNTMISDAWSARAHTLRIA